MPSDQHVRVDFRTYLAVGLTIVLWASAFAGIRAGLVSYTPEAIALLRYLTASAVLAGYALLTKMPLPRAARPARPDWHRAGRFYDL